jgi:nucleotide-binding universal stress UspA family protein
MFNNILVAVKFSTAGAQALELAIRMAKNSRAHLHLFHAMDYRLQPDHPELNQQQEAIENRIRRDVQAVSGDLEQFSVAVYPADPAMEVCKLARRIGADLIVLGCHQRSGMTAMGRVDYVGMTILEKAPCPVMLIPQRP